MFPAENIRVLLPAERPKDCILPTIKNTRGRNNFQEISVRLLDGNFILNKCHITTCLVNSRCKFYEEL